MTDASPSRPEGQATYAEMLQAVRDAAFDQERLGKLYDDDRRRRNVAILDRLGLLMDAGREPITDAMRKAAARFNHQPRADKD